jgi:hypothetical protein
MGKLYLYLSLDILVVFPVTAEAHVQYIITRQFFSR